MSETIKKTYGEEKEKVFDYRRAMEEASRCLLCEDAPCSKGCPAATDPAKFIRSLRFKNIRGAAETIRENNPLGGCCAWVCPYDRMCEAQCSRSGIDRPIEIGRLQRFLIEEEEREKLTFIPKKEKNGKKVVCIGAGPASLSCARELAKEGYTVKVLEEREKAGGVLTYGIVPTRLPQYVIDHDIALIEDLGVEFEFGKRIEPGDIETLKEEYDAVFVGIGLWSGKQVDIEGIALEGVENAIAFLERARTNPNNISLGENVLIIGCGNVAMDCASTAKQLGSRRTAVIYRRSIEEAPADMEELRFVQESGIPIFTEFAPAKILGENGKVVALECKGRDGYSEMKIKADNIILAIGQEQVESYKEFILSEGVFIGGDAANKTGATVVEAVADGKYAAAKIVEYLS